MGGGLPGGPYQLAQGHLHWANSEHTIDGVSEKEKTIVTIVLNMLHQLFFLFFIPPKLSSKVELHLVHFNLARGQTLNEAVATNEYDALAVLGIMIEIGNSDLERVDEFFNGITTYRVC